MIISQIRHTSCDRCREDASIRLILPQEYGSKNLCNDCLTDLIIEGIETREENGIGYKTCEQLLEEIRPLVTEEGYEEYSYWTAPQLEKELDQLQNFLTDVNVGY